MSLAFYDADQVAYSSSPLRTFHDGRLGTVQEVLFYLKNAAAGYYYTDITVQPEVDTGTWGTFQDTGWSVKAMAGQRQPTEGEWNEVQSGDAVPLADIGTTLVADTGYHPIWVRVFCPGLTPSQIRDDVRLNLTYVKRLLGT